MGCPTIAVPDLHCASLRSADLHQRNQSKNIDSRYVIHSSTHLIYS
jgi:hypothetical protein